MPISSDKDNINYQWSENTEEYMANRRSTLAALVLLSCAILPLLVSPNKHNDDGKSPLEKAGDDLAKIIKDAEGGHKGKSPLEKFSDDLARIIKGREGGQAVLGFSNDGKHKHKKQKKKKHAGIPTGPNPGNQGPRPTPGVLREGFYKESCPRAENIVKDVITKTFQRDPTLAPSLVRLFFHDCFITGCDASLLLDRTPTREAVEKRAPQNGIFVRGFEVIDDIKASLEAECPGIVSCADALAFANRDSLVFSRVPPYPVAAGRRDGRESLATIAETSLPTPESTAQQMIDVFQARGFSIEEMVVLSGAHSIGSAHCTVVAGRFHNPKMWADMDSGYIMKMQVLAACDNVTQDLPFDPFSQQKMDSRYYKELLNKRALLESDHNLAKEPRAKAVMKKYADDQVGWLTSFTDGITKMGSLGVLTGDQGEVRKQCRVVN